MTLREVELGTGDTLRIREHSDLENEAGAVVWDCALVLAHFLHHPNPWIGPRELEGARVVELGSGTGLVGLSIALLASSVKVVLTDLPKFIGGLQENIKENRLQGSVKAAAYIWGEPIEELETPQVDWIVASDVIYAHDAVEPLLQALLMLSSEPTRILIAYELRAGSEGWIKTMASGGIVFKKLPNRDLHPDWQADDIGIFIGQKATG
mmetsp:Transcript_38211/g.107992  ORF Transcript_38211/g.107992 Transcript_38211/m.107992 type:complete len:209 (-) Transcript_38211:238-864(-)|eukprot:CAMPEP_0117674104 /NCGR_PEP_ID=MMETSP0804-20121206/14848_1 /TAXON_ID=1074897 /ORGANISM="Tetraselmis astigmatica, Strain CCMP880" /LENGTH=208 /DNA_ID=CAMNT_0005482927 /DNA_START=437 /DNA_END=1063 /DNA_ORIENTATION=+